jgi:hypothetical protein
MAPGFIGTDVIDRSSFYLLVDNKRIIGNVTIYIYIYIFSLLLLKILMLQ